MSFSSVFGRIIKIKKAEDCKCLAIPERRLVLLMSEDGVAKARSFSGYEMLKEIGYKERHIQYLLREGFKFKLVVFRLNNSEARKADWQNVIWLTSLAYPDVADKLFWNIDTLKNKPFEYFEEAAGFSFEKVDENGRHDPRFMTYERFKLSSGTAVETRMFLYFTLQLNEYFAGNGWTLTKDGRRGVREFITFNKLLMVLNFLSLENMEVNLPKKEGEIENERAA